MGTVTERSMRKSYPCTTARKKSLRRFIRQLVTLRRFLKTWKAQQIALYFASIGIGLAMSWQSGALSRTWCPIKGSNSFSYHATTSIANWERLTTLFLMSAFRIKTSRCSTWVTWTLYFWFKSISLISTSLVMRPSQHNRASTRAR